MIDWHRNISYEAAQLGVSLRTNNGHYFCEGFVIKPLQRTLRIMGYVWLLGDRQLVTLFETGSMEYANKALRRAFLVSREMARIKSFAAFKDDTRIVLQMELGHHAENALCNFIAEENRHGPSKYENNDRVDISARYYVPCANDKSSWHFRIHNEFYLEKRLETPHVQPTERDFTKVRKFAAPSFNNGALIDDLNNLHMLNLPYKIVAHRVEMVTQYDEDSQDIFREYNIEIPTAKTAVHYIAVKVPRTDFVPGAASPYALGC